MSIENENVESVNESVESVDTNDTGLDTKSIAKEMVDSLKGEINSIMSDAKKEVSAERAKKSVKIFEVDQKIGNFNSKRELEIFAKSFVPEYGLRSAGNTKALTTYANFTTDADGGSIDPVTANGILARSIAKYNSYEEDTLMAPCVNSSCTFVDMTSDATAYMTAEAVAISESKAGLTTRTVSLKKIAVMAPVTNDLQRFGTLADIANVVYESMGRAISKKKQHLIFKADGTSDTTDGGVTGLISTLTGVSNNASIIDFTGEWDDIELSDLAGLEALCSDWADQDNMAWYCNKAMWRHLEKISRVAGSTPYLQLVGQAPVPYFCGYPVKFVNAMPSSYVDGEVGLIFGDLKGCVATGDLGRVDITVHPDFYAQQDATCYRAVSNFGVLAYQPGTSSAATSVVGITFNGS